MRKLYLLLDEWINDKNFVGSELELIKKKFDVTVICNDFENKESFSFPEQVSFSFYKRPSGIKILPVILKTVLDPVTWHEFNHIKSETDKITKISEIVRFYINAELFYSFMKKNGYISKDSDAIYYSYWYFWKCFAITKHRKSHPGINIITRTHEYDLYTVSIPSGYQPFKYTMDDNLDKIVFIAEHGRQFYLSKYRKLPSDKYALYHLGTKDYAIKNPHVKQNKIVIASCSSIIPRKRVDLILNGISLIDDINIEWIHFGSGEDMASLKELASQKLDTKHNITYTLMGYTKHEDVMKFYSENSVDLFIMAAVSEGNPVSVIEALSFGIPVISTNICNMSTLVTNNGFLISENPESKELADAITAFANLDENTVNQMRDCSYSIWDKNFREEVNNERFINEVLMML